MNISIQAVEVYLPIQPSKRLESARYPASPTPLKGASQLSPAINNNHITHTAPAHTQLKAYSIAMYKLHITQVSPSQRWTWRPSTRTGDWGIDGCNIVCTLLYEIQKLGLTIITVYTFRNLSHSLLIILFKITYLRDNP